MLLFCCCQTQVCKSFLPSKTASSLTMLQKQVQGASVLPITTTTSPALMSLLKRNLAVTPNCRNCTLLSVSTASSMLRKGGAPKSWRDEFTKLRDGELHASPTPPIYTQSVVRRTCYSCCVACPPRPSLFLAVFPLLNQQVSEKWPRFLKTSHRFKSIRSPPAQYVKLWTDDHPALQAL